MKKTYLLVAALLMASTTFAQRMKKEKLNVRYVQPPTIHLEDGMGFHSDVILDYKAEIDAELAAAEEEDADLPKDSCDLRLRESENTSVVPVVFLLFSTASLNAIF